MYNITINSRGGGVLYKVTSQPTAHNPQRKEDAVNRG